MSSSKLQKQVSQLQSQLDSKRAKTPTRRNESQNSRQRRRSKSKGPKTHPRDSHAISINKDQKRSNHYKGIQELDWKKARVMPSMLTVDQVLTKINAAHKRAESVKIPVWDHKQRITVDGKTRFQTFAEWKATQPKPSLLAEALKENKCKHEYVPPSKFRVNWHCRICSEDQKDEKNDIVAEQFKELYEAACQEFEVARNALRAGLKDRPIRLRLTQAMHITTTVTTGVTNTVICSATNSNLTAARCSEFAGLAAIFDEFKTMGGEVVFNYRNPVSNATAGTLTEDSIPAMGFDIDIGTGATGVLQITQMAQHKLFDAGVGGSSIIACPASSIRHNFKWHVPSGTLIGASQIGRDWQPTGGSPLPVGDLLFYHVGACITADVTGAGIIYFDTEFRCRT